MTKGDLLLFNAETEYRICPAEETVTYIVLNFDYTESFSHITTPVSPKPVGSFQKRDIVEKVCFRDAPELSLPVHLEKKLDIMNRALEINREFSRKILHYDAKISNIPSEILIDCVREIKLQTTADGYERINEILKYIHENSGLKMTNLSLGKKFGFHPNYISYLIKRYTGTSLHKYLLNVKLFSAIDMLDEGKLSVGEIAERCGFCDIYYFSRFFKQHLGISPLEYRGKKNT